MGDNKLSKKQWQKAQKLFADAIVMNATQAEMFLRQSCSEDQELYNTLLSMLEMDQKSANDTLIPVNPLKEIYGNIRSIQPGVKFGKFTVLKHLASGGMGNVYLARRDDDQVHQTVAIKIQSNTLLDENSQNRFHMEKRILASLEHPGIARLIDAGETDSNSYCVMEYVDGVPITEFCQNNTLDIKQRLKLFLQVCDAVSYAHANLIVHRDLKPNNILVTESGDIKLLDFGIAKPLNLLPGTNKLHQTVEGFSALTPNYAAPEQFTGKTVGTACDIYALGLLLYELLTNKEVFDFSNKTWGEIERMVTCEIPVDPSRQIIKNNINLKHFRLDSTNQLRKLLRGDLDSIVQYALKKESTQRYSSVAAFAEDLKNYLKHRPVKIKGHQKTYRLKKYLQRNWLPVGALMAFIMTMMISSIIVFKQSQNVQFERDKAVQEKQVAEQVTNFLINTFKSADPTKALGNKLTAEDILLEGVIQLNYETHDSTVKNRLLVAMGEVFYHLAEYEQAQQLLDQINIQEETTNIELNSLVYRVKANNLAAQDKFKQASELITKLERNIPTSNKIDLITVLTMKARVMMALEQRKEGKLAIQQAFDLSTEVNGADSPEHALEIINFAAINSEVGNRPETLKTYEQAHTILDAQPNNKFITELIRLKLKLAGMYSKQQDYKSAIAHTNRAEKLALSIYKPNHMIFASIENRKGIDSQRTGDLVNAIRHYKNSIEIKESHLGKGTYKATSTLYNIALITYKNLKKPLESVTLFEHVLDIISNTQGKTNKYHYMQITYTENLIDLNRYEEAHINIIEALNFYAQANAIAGFNLAKCRAILAHIFIVQQQFVQANKLLQKALPVLQKRMDKNDFFLIRTSSDFQFIENLDDLKPFGQKANL